MYYCEPNELYFCPNVKFSETKEFNMRMPKAVGKNVIMKIIKEKEKEPVNGIIIQEVNKKPVKFYEVLDSNNDKIKPGNIVYLNGFSHAVEIDGLEYHICNEDAVAAVLQ